MQSETQKQAGDQVSISNTIGSLRFLGSMDWREFVETMSVVEHKLREDPGGLYGRMDFATRDRYRHVVEEIAKGSQLSESDVARKAIQLAHDGTGGNVGQTATTIAPPTSASIWSTRDGRGSNRRRRCVLPPPQALHRLGRRIPLLLYLGSIAAITAALTAALLAEAQGDGVADAVLVTLAILLLLATSQLAVGMVNWVATLLVTPRACRAWIFRGDCRRSRARWW